jgi:hypothetical protein
MPSYGWSAPSSFPLGATSGTVNSGFVSGTLADISPYPCLVQAGLLNLGTRIRLIAQGSYTGTSTTTTLAFGFYMNAPASAISGALVLGVAATGTMFSGTGFPWLMEYWGHVAAISTTGSTTAASFVGRGRVMFGTALTTWNTLVMPTTLAAVTVAQTSNTVGNTAVEQNIQVGVTPAVTVTGLTNIITDELTCELIG